MVVDHLIVLVHGSFVHISASSLSGRSRRWRKILSFCDSFEKDVLELEDAQAIHLPDADQPHSLVGGLSAPLSLALYPTWGMAYAPGRISVMAFLNRTTIREVDNQGCVLALPRFEVATLPYL